MTLMVTGATGFVMSVLARHWLDADPRDRSIVPVSINFGMFQTLSW